MFMVIRTVKNPEVNPSAHPCLFPDQSQALCLLYNEMSLAAVRSGEEAATLER